MFLQHQGKNSAKTLLFTVFLRLCVEHTVFCDVSLFPLRAQTVSPRNAYTDYSGYTGLVAGLVGCGWLAVVGWLWLAGWLALAQPANAWSQAQRPSYKKWEGASLLASK